MTTEVVSGGTSLSNRWRAPSSRLRAVHWTLAALLALLAGVGVALAPIRPAPAVAAAPALTIRLSQSTVESRVGQTVQLTAVVEATVPGLPVLQNGWAVEFSGTNGGWTSGLVFTADGEATYVRRGEIIGTDAITATLVNSGCVGASSNTVVHDWWQPQITLSPVDSVSTYDSTASVTANLHGENNRLLAGQRLTFTVQQVDFSSGQFSETVTTDANGNATISWRRPSTADVVEAIRVQETDQSEPARAGGSHVWDQPIDPTLQIDLTQSSTDSRTGTELAIRATARIGGTPAANRPLLMYSTETGGLVTQQTNADGVAVFVKTATTPGADNLLFYFRNVQGSVSTLHQWWSAPTITTDLSGDDSDFVERVRRPTATASFLGRPEGGQALTLQVRGGSPITQVATTNTSGRASFDGWTRTAPGQDIASIGPVESVLNWTQPTGPPVVVALRHDDPDAVRVGQPAAFVATVTSIGHTGPQALSGWDVTLYDASSQTVLNTATTDGGGRAVLATAQDHPDRLTVYAAVDLPGCGRIVSTPLSETWALPELTFGRAGYSGTAGSTVSVSARLSVAGRPLPGELLDFASGSTDCALPDLTASARTDQNGIATVSLSRDVPSLDRLSVVEDDALDPQRRQTTLTWGRPPRPSTRITLRQSSPDGRVGTSDVLTATVTDTGDGRAAPVAGASVQFAGAGTGQVFLTGPDGTVSYVDRPTTARTDQITASTPYGCDRLVSAPVSHEWWLPTLTLAPTDATSTVGDTASIRATLTHDGSRVTGEPLALAIDNSAGAADLPNGSQPATVDGREAFSWSRSSPGTDTITATEVGVPSPVQAGTTRRWQPREPVVTLTATPDGTSGSVGDTFTVTADLELDGSPATGVDIALDVGMAGQPEITSTQNTDATGRAEFGWTRPVQGTDQVNGPRDGGRFSGRTVTHPRLDRAAAARPR